MMTLQPQRASMPPFHGTGTLAPLMVEYHWNGTNCDFFPPDVKLKEPLLQAVLRQFSKEERSLLQEYFQIPWDVDGGATLMDKLKNLRIEEEAKTVFRFLKKWSGDDNGTEFQEERGEKVPPTSDPLHIPTFQENQDIATRLQLFYQENFHQIPVLLPIHWKQESRVWNPNDTTTKEEKQRNQGLQCLFELLALCQEAQMEEMPHPLVGRAVKFKERQDYCHFLMVYTCGESTISGYQLHYLEQLSRQFHLSSQWFLEALTSCLKLDHTERISALIVQYALYESEIHPILLEDAITLDLLGDPKKIKGDKGNLPRYLCKNQEQRNHEIEQIKNKRLGVTL